ncbi:L,D-transpeptidase family protein [Roseiarcaceae bacterium H3SJ34-1]|uniref:L,D-transpeptidase family protein n=1 Tax=Terripilifer ovatus TaxID=3032367 RepID=UPI003AB91CFA|nr:L,D-transpeptidase family protein [Roseiarcaceae bacterium H3SJ34-1]
MSVPLPPEAGLSQDVLAGTPAETENAAAPASPAVDVAVEPPAENKQAIETPPAVPAPATAQTTIAPALAKDTAKDTGGDTALRELIQTATAALVEPEQAARATTKDLAKAQQAQRKEREAIVAFYTGRDNAPVWVSSGGLTEAGRSLVARLARASDDGLDLKGFTQPNLTGADEATLAKAELALTQTAVDYARQASGARVDPRSIGLITAKPEIAEPAAILAAIAAPGIEAGDRLAEFNPPHAGYRALRTKLAELRRENPAMASQRIGPGPELRVGMKDRRVPLIRARLGIDPAGDNDPLLYDIRVASAVADFNRANGLSNGNTLTSRTIAKLSGGEPLRLEAELISNMERWRWVPRDMGDTRIEVNIPDYKVKVTRDGEVVHTARVIVGKPQNPTPVFSDTMRHVIVNPYWNVPVSIIKKEMMPGYAKDPSYFQKRGYEVTSYRGQMVVRQPPGERNALGRIKFMFPNEHSVYLHDTPSRGLFANARRAYSHGCVRVENPFKLAEIVLGKDNGWSEAKVRSLIGGGERLINLPQLIPIHIEYFTAFVDDEGKVQLREDIYGYSHKVQAALGL